MLARIPLFLSFVAYINLMLINLTIKMYYDNITSAMSVPALSSLDKTNYQYDVQSQ